MSLRDELQAIYDQHGRLTPALVLETARPENSPLHEMVFALGAREAAEAWYLERAQELITRVKIVYAQTPEGPKEVRAWQAVQAESGWTYEPAETVARSGVLTAILLRDMKREWKQMQQRYGQFGEFVRMVRESVNDQAA